VVVVCGGSGGAGTGSFLGGFAYGWGCWTSRAMKKEGGRINLDLRKRKHSPPSQKEDGSEIGRENPHNTYYRKREGGETPSPSKRNRNSRGTEGGSLSLLPRKERGKSRRGI